MRKQLILTIAAVAVACAPKPQPAPVAAPVAAAPKPVVAVSAEALVDHTGDSPETAVTVPTDAPNEGIDFQNRWIFDRFGRFRRTGGGIAHAGETPRRAGTKWSRSSCPTIPGTRFTSTSPKTKRPGARSKADQSAGGCRGLIGADGQADDSNDSGSALDHDRAADPAVGRDGRLDRDAFGARVSSARADHARNRRAHASL